MSSSISRNPVSASGSLPSLSSASPPISAKSVRRTGATLARSRCPASEAVTNCAAAALPSAPRAMRASTRSSAWSSAALSISAWIERPSPISSAPALSPPPRPEIRRASARIRPL